MSENNPVVFCTADLKTIKQASLFYGTVVPFPFEVLHEKMPDVMTSEQVVKNIWEVIPEQYYQQLIWPISYFMAKPEEFGIAGHEFRAKFLALLLLLYSLGIDVKKSKVTSEHIEKAIKALDFSNFAIEPIIVMPEENLRSDTAQEDDISITLSNLNLIDTKAASWDQIMEVRKNKESMKKLRNLRLFLQTNYSGKSKQFVEDDLAKRLEDYQNVVKDYGFETFTAALTVITNANNLLAICAASTAALLVGQPVLATASLVSGVFFELAQVSVEIANKRHEFNKYKRDHDLSYIIDINEFFRG